MGDKVRGGAAAAVTAMNAVKRIVPKRCATGEAKARNHTALKIRW